MVTQKLHIITPVTRIENLSKLHSSIENNSPEGLLIRWWIIIDPIVPNKKPKLNLGNKIHSIKFVQSVDENATAGHKHRNYVLNILERSNSCSEDWIMSLDDDNIVHPDLFKLFNSSTHKVPLYDGIIVSQVNKDRSLRLKADPDNVKVNNVDTAQFIFRTKILKGLRFKEDLYNADGYFIQELYEKNKDRFLIIDKPLSYYNFLR